MTGQIIMIHLIGDSVSVKFAEAWKVNLLKTYTYNISDWLK